MSLKILLLHRSVLLSESIFRVYIFYSDPLDFSATWCRNPKTVQSTIDETMNDRKLKSNFGKLNAPSEPGSHSNLNNLHSCMFAL